MAKGDPIGPLHGVPVTTKINTDQKGCATTNGVAAFAGLIAHEDSPSIANLRRAGAIVIGRTNVPEFSWRWFTDNELLWRNDQSVESRSEPAAGSSGGAAVAVATGMCPLSQGSDFGGSIRHPHCAAAWLDFVQQLGRVPAYNASTGDRPITAQLMAVHGPIARRVGDLQAGACSHGGRRRAGPLVGTRAIERPRAGKTHSGRSRRQRAVGRDSIPASPMRWSRLPAGCRMRATSSNRPRAPSIEEASHLWSTLVLNEAKLSMISQHQPARRRGDPQDRAN